MRRWRWRRTDEQGMQFDFSVYRLAHELGLPTIDVAEWPASYAEGHWAYLAAKYRMEHPDAPRDDTGVKQQRAHERQKRAQQQRMAQKRPTG